MSILRLSSYKVAKDRPTGTGGHHCRTNPVLLSNGALEKETTRIPVPAVPYNKDTIDEKLK
jgi:hypothetical protein